MRRLLWWVVAFVMAFVRECRLRVRDVNDGGWHLVHMTYDPVAADGLRTKYYVDGLLMDSAVDLPVTFRAPEGKPFTVGAHVRLGKGGAKSLADVFAVAVKHSRPMLRAQWEYTRG